MSNIPKITQLGTSLFVCLPDAPDVGSNGGGPAGGGGGGVSELAWPSAEEGAPAVADVLNVDEVRRSLFPS